MKWRYETYEEKRDRLEKWHRWFAWKIVRVNGVAYWLTTLERKAIPAAFSIKASHLSLGLDPMWEYREPLSDFESAMEDDSIWP